MNRVAFCFPVIARLCVFLPVCFLLLSSASDATTTPTMAPMNMGPATMATAQPGSDIEAYKKIAAAHDLSFDGTAWSVFNHRGSGLFVLLWGLTALIVALLRPRRTWLRFVAPLMLFGLVEFLLLRNDPKVWPLGPIPFWLSFQSPEVFQHRVFITIILAIGIVELLRAADRLPPLAYKYAIPGIAVVGAILILFHQHGGPEMQQAMQMAGPAMTGGTNQDNMNASMALIKHQHRWFAILGFGFAATKLLDDAGRRPQRLWGTLWPLFLVAVGVLLMNYSE